MMQRAFINVLRLVAKKSTKSLGDQYEFQCYLIHKNKKLAKKLGISPGTRGFSWTGNTPTYQKLTLRKKGFLCCKKDDFTA